MAFMFIQIRLQILKILEQLFEVHYFSVLNIFLHLKSIIVL